MDPAVIRRLAIILVVAVSVQGAARADDGAANAPSLHGFLLAETAGRITAQRPPGGDDGDYVLGEERLRLELTGGAGGARFLAKGELAHDSIGKQFAVDLREAYVAYAVGPADVRLGRLIVTWGVGDLFFINDVFPKDWESFFSGRPLEYLKLGVDGVQARLSTRVVDAELLAIPSFTPDTLPSPSRFSFFFPHAGVPGQSQELPPSRFSNTELAVRLYRQLAGFDLSLYAYRGHWRMPSVRLDDPVAPTIATRFFPALSTYGASTQRNLLAGTLSVEAGYYDSRGDRTGSDPVIPNSHWRFLAGYQRELVPDFMAGLQVYGELMSSYQAYRGSVPAGAPLQDEFRGVLSLRLTRLLDYQAWRLSLFVAYSPTDEDYLVQPEVSYKVTDALSVRVGANVLGGRQPSTFFGQFGRNDNVFVAGRLDF
jgi:hypothetical protein